jgi:serine/threonine protein kinase
MEYAALGALTDVMKLSGRSVLVEDEIASLCKSMLLGLQYLHAANKIHRDILLIVVQQTAYILNIKPENVLITAEGEPKLGNN